jgi:hemolysin activation/secretion protein
VQRVALVALLLLGRAAAGGEPAAAELRSLETRGATVYTPEQAQKILRLRPGDSLRREPAAIAATLETRYHDEGYLAARVAGVFDAASGTLRLSVDEGRIAEAQVEGTSARAAATALEQASLRPGELLRAEAVFSAFERLEQASDGAFEPGDYRIERVGADGVRIVLVPRRRTARVDYRLSGPTRRYGRADGLNLPLGADLTLFDHASFNHVTPYFVSAYGLASKHLRYAAGVSRPFGGSGGVTLGYEYHDLTDSDDAYRSVGLEEAHGTAILSTSYGDYFRRRGHEAYAFVRVAPRAQLGLSFRSDDYTSLPVAIDAKDARPNPPIDAGRSRSGIASFRFDASDPLFASRARERHSFVQRSLYGLYPEPPRFFRGEATFEVASKDALGGDFTFRRLIANLRGRAPLPARQRLDARLLVGLSGGTLPLQKRFALGGLGTLRGYDMKLFPGANLALANLEWSIAPAGPLPRVIVFYDGGVVWTHAQDGAGWKSDLGLGLRFPADTGAFLRLDFARAVSDPSEKRVRTLFRIQLPI